MYYVYVHSVPNGKIYIGQSKDPLKRWNNGEGYLSNRPFYKDIQVYGWNNIKHEIVANFPTAEQALQTESVLIAMLKSENENYGYNQTTIYEDAIKKYTSRVEMKDASFEDSEIDESFFESSNLPVSACVEMINQWIFNDAQRNILKSRLIDGLGYKELSEKYGKSVRQLKNIVYNGCKKLKKHF